jgi:hypothetical protein
MSGVRACSRVHLLAACGLLVLTGCGTTVEGGTAQQVAGQPVDGLGYTTSGGPGSAGPVSGLTDAAGVGGLPADGSAISAPSGMSAAAGGDPQPAAAGSSTSSSGAAVDGGETAAGPTGTVSRGTVTLGFWGGAGDTTGAFGGNGSQSLGDEEEQFQALVDDANASGGLAGHRIRAVFYRHRSANTVDQANQEACAFFTQDNKAFAVMTSQNIANALLRQCLTSRGIPLIKNYLADVGAATLRKSPLYMLPSMINLDRIAATQPAALQRAGFFSKGAPVGVVTQDDAEFAHAVDRILIPGIVRLGYQVRATARFQTPQNADGVQAMGAAASNAVLKFRQEGIEHVVFLSPNGISATVFLNTAESQQYRPRYAFTSQDAIQGLVSAGIIQNYPQQLENAVGIGWVPSIDVPFTAQAEFNQRPRARQCLSVLAKRDQRPKSAQELLHATLNCDAFWLVRDALAGRSLSSSVFLSSVDAMGSRFPTAATFATTLGRDRHDGASAIRPFAFVNACRCFRYTAGAQPTA